MSNSVFLEFLSRIKQQEKNISLLSNKILEIEDMKRRYFSEYLTQEITEGIVNMFKKKMDAFYMQTQEIKKSIERIQEDYTINGILEERMKIHILTQQESLAEKTKIFLETKSSFLRTISEKQEFLSLFEDDSVWGKEKKEEPPNYRRETEDSEKEIGDVRIKNLLMEMENINATAMDLNEIISNSGMEIKSAESKLFFSKKMSAGVNSQIETTTNRRKRRRRLKTVCFLLVVGVCSVIFIYFGKQILEFIAKLKDATK